MNISHLLNVPCTLVSVTDAGEDDYGDPIETTVETATVCWHERRGAGDETTGEADWQADRQDLYLHATEDVSGLDRVVIGGVTFDVIGPPHTHVHPRTATAEFISAVIGVVS